MATVFLARDVRHERKVAIKVLHEDLGAAVGAERFRREIQIATSLTHPHILTLYDSGEAAGSLYYVMPFIEGESLRHRMDREKQLPIDQALKITGEVASALGYAHRKGIVHRDIKPENILLEDGHAIVADFGIARAVMADSGGALTKTGMSLGTPTYMSPEQAFAEKDIDGRSDMYSLACVLYEMLTGEPPFTGPNAQAIMARHSMSEVPSMKIVRATVPDEVELVVEKALAKSPADRYATIEEFAQELEECVIDYHTTTRRAVTDRRTAPRVPPGRRAADVDKKWFLKPAFLGGVAALLLILGGAGWWKFGRTPSSLAATSGGFDERKVAVLYFQDLSSNGQLGYLADGLTESLIERLQQVPALNVISASGVSQFRGSEPSVDSVATALNVGTIVKGTIEPDNDKYKVKVRLVNSNSGDIIATQEFEQPMANVLAATDTLAGKVASLLQSKIGVEVSLKSERAKASDAVAWTLLQRAEKLRKEGERLASQDDAAGSAKSFASADSLLSDAEKRDPRWIGPIVKKAVIAISRVRAAGNAVEAQPFIEKGLADAQRAVQRDPKDPDALEARGTLRYMQWAYNPPDDPSARDALLDGAESDLQNATTIDPTNASAWNVLSTVYSQKDDNTNAKLAAATAYREDAYLTGTDKILWRLYATSYDLEQFPDAKKYCDEEGRRFPESAYYVRCQLWLQTVPGITPDPQKAWQNYAALEKLTKPAEWASTRSEAMTLVAASLGRTRNPALLDSARRVLDRARPAPGTDKEGELAGVEAFVLTLFGTPQDSAEAFKVLGKYVAGSSQHRAGLRDSQSWWWKGLKQDKRFEELIAGAR